MNRNAFGAKYKSSGMGWLGNVLEQASIDKLREYRITRISAAVTGKINMRGEVA